MSKRQILWTMLDSEIGKSVFGKATKTACHLWVWATSNHLDAALWLMQCLGFEYKTSAVWVKAKFVEGEMGEKLQMGLGQYMRHCHEMLLLGTRGQAMIPNPAERKLSVIVAARTRHSEKPVEAYSLIESVSPGPRLELFARKPRAGWDVWGNEVGPT
jgi:N6-adenosine-specific RNA methylase IME4